MNEEQKQTNTDRQPEKTQSLFRRITRILAKVALYIIIALAALSLSIFALSQFKFFRSWVANTLLNIANDALLAKIEIGDLYINPFSGIVIEDFRMTVAGDTLAAADALFIDPDYLPLLENRLIINSLQLDNPRIKLLRSLSDSAWNFDKITKPSTEEKPSEEESTGSSNFFVDLRQMVLNHAVITIFDSTKTYSSFGYLDPTNMQLEIDQLSFDGKANINQMDFSGSLSITDCLEAQSGLFLKELGLDFSANQGGIELNNVKIETGSCNAGFSLIVGNINVFESIGNEELGNAQITFNADMGNISLGELSRIIGLQEPLSGDLSGEISLSGTPKKLKIKSFELQLNDTDISLSGKVENALDFDNIKFDISFNKSLVRFKDLMSLSNSFANIGIPDFGNIKIKKLNTSGNLNNVDAELSFDSDFGSLDIGAKLALKPVLTYEIELVTQKFNPAAILNNAQLAGNINSVFKIKGSGTKLEDLSAEFSVLLENSSFNDFNIRDLLCVGSFSEGGMLRLDTLNIKLLNKSGDLLDSLQMSDYSSFECKGILNIIDINKPEYSFSANINNLNLASILHAQFAPNTLSCNLDLNGEGMEPDSINVELESEILECSFGDRSLVPFDMKVIIDMDDSIDRKISVESDFANVEFKGDFNLSNIISLIEKQISYIGGFITRKINNLQFIATSSDSSEESQERIGGFEPMNLSIIGEIIDLSPLSIFVPDVRIFCKAKLDMLLEINDSSSFFNIKLLDVEVFNLQAGDASVLINQSEIKGKLELNVVDSLISISEINLNYEGSNDNYINDLKISSPMALIELKEESAAFQAKAEINEQLETFVSGGIDFYSDSLKVKLNKMSLQLNQMFHWFNVQDIMLSYGKNGLNIESFSMKRPNCELIKIEGSYNGAAINGGIIRISSFPLNSVLQFLPNGFREQFEKISGGIDTLEFRLEGKLDNPKIDLRMESNYLSYNGNTIGRIVAGLNYQYQTVTGDIKLLAKDKSELMTVNVQSLPIDLSLSGNEKRFFDDRQLEVHFVADSTPLDLVAPFVQGVSDLRGSFNMDVALGGYLPDKFNITGNLHLNQTSMLVDATNLRYTAYGDINLTMNEIVINKLYLKNNPIDDENGNATITGSLKHDRFEIKNFDFIIRSPGLKVMSYATQKAMPNLFGNMTVATGSAPLRLQGTFDKAYLTGDVNILDADLTLPNTVQKRTIQSRVVYINYDKSNPPPALFKKDSLKAEGDTTQNKAQEPEKKHNIIEKRTTFMDILSIDIFVRFLGKFLTKMDVASIGSLIAEIGTSTPQEALHVMMEGSASPTVYGSLQIKDNSKITFLKTFTTSGDISFPTGSIENPGLNLTAVHTSRNPYGSSMREITVKMVVTGNKNAPNIKFSYSIDNKDAVGDSATIAQDALFLLIFGKTKSEIFSPSQSSELFSANEVANTLLGSMATSAFANIIGSTGVVKTIDIDLGGGDMNKARINVSGSAYIPLIGYVGWRLGGNISDFTSNNEMSIDIPLWMASDSSLINSIIFQLSRTLNSAAPTSRNQKDWEVKVRFGGSF
jgi:hypothetical protein